MPSGSFVRSCRKCKLCISKNSCARADGRIHADRALALLSVGQLVVFRSHDRLDRDLSRSVGILALNKIIYLFAALECVFFIAALFNDPAADLVSFIGDRLQCKLRAAGISFVFEICQLVRQYHLYSACIRIFSARADKIVVSDDHESCVFEFRIIIFICSSAFLE